MDAQGRADQYYWCLKHHRVENGTTRCKSDNLLGPYGSTAQAEMALQRVRERNEAWDAEDARWHGEAS
jgi:hypothetical protein